MLLRAPDRLRRPAGAPLLGRSAKLAGAIDSQRARAELVAHAERPVEILELVPAERLAYSWRWEEQETVVRWELEGSGGRTRLTLVHSGFGEDRDAEGYRLGWQAFLVSLRRLVELGDAWRKPEDVDLATR